MDNLESSRSPEFSKILQLHGNGAYGDPVDGDATIKLVWGARSVQLFGANGQEIAECGFDQLIKSLGVELKPFTCLNTNKTLTHVEIKKVEVLTKLFRKINQRVEIGSDLDRALAQEQSLFNILRQAPPPSEDHEILTPEQALQKANSLAEEGKPIFELEPNGGAQLSSEYFHPTNRSLKDYTQFPAVQKAFHEYLKTKLDVHANVDPTLFFNFFFSNSDTEVIKVLMNYLEDNKNTELTTITSKTHELKKSLDNCISSAFQRSKKEDIDLLLKSIPVKTLLTRSLFSQLQCTNNSEMQHYMIELGYTPTEREL